MPSPATMSDDVKTADGAPERPVNRRVRVVAFGVLPALVMALGLAAALAKWAAATQGSQDSARLGSVQAATEGAVAMLSYTPDTAQADLVAAQDLLTGEFRGSYRSLVQDVVIPASQQKQISAMANVPAAAAVSTNGDGAVVLLFVNQTVTIGDDAPTNSNSSVRVSLEKVADRWLISGFDPV